MKRGPISLNAHAAMEPVAAVLFIVAPWLFGFSDVTEATTISVVVGVVMLISGMLTRWRYSVMKLIPLRTHFMTDVALATLLILSPFIFGFSDEGGAARFTIIAGVLELLTALGTRWDPAEAGVPSHGRNRGRASRASAAR
jgi:SPW repeat